jgi:asparagine synthase (glutamine-hydrolysing)
MCGIGGFLWLREEAAAFDAPARLRAMIETLRHRGPDDEGIWTDGVCGHAHARLSIIDLSAAGHQPMGSADGRVWITYNGEIYNFIELRQELESKGFVFRTRSDTEVIVCGYQVWGEGVLTRLRGMFAIALWDNVSKRLLLARDRLGKKPLYYARVGDLLLFGSEIKALLVWPEVDRRADMVAIDQFLSLQYVPSPRTAFEGIRKLPPAHYIAAQRFGTGWRISEPVEYWRLPSPRAATGTFRAEALAAELLERLKEAVKLRLVSDVPLGAFLSGGVDSSSVVALMSEFSSGPVRTFSIGFPDKEYDETHYARMVAQRYSTDHEEMIVEPDAIAIIPRLVWHYGEPFADPSAVPTYYVSEMARRKVKVALNGDGGDECFMGYGRYATCRRIARFDSTPLLLRKLIATAVMFLPRSVHRRYGNRLSNFANLIGGDDRRQSQRYAFTISYFMDHMKQDGYTDDMSARLAGSALDLLEPYFDAAPTLVSGANWADIHTYLPDDLMVKVDVASMAHGLESRSPLLDHVFMEWAMSIPEHIKMAGGITKTLFKKAMEPYLPQELLYRPKMGFGCPVDHWFRGVLKEMAYDVLLSDAATSRQIFRRAYVEKLLDEHVSGRFNHHTRLWALLMLELWFRMWIDESRGAAVVRPGTVPSGAQPHEVSMFPS